MYKIPAIFFFLLISSPVYAESIDPSDIAQWLCNAISSGELQQHLKSFPGTSGEEVVQHSSPSGPGWKLKSSRVEVTYEYQIDGDDPEPYGFELEIEPDLDVAVFRTDEEARSWLSRIGPVSKDTLRSGSSMFTAKAGSPYVSKSGRTMERLKVQVSMSSQSISVSWFFKQDANLGRKFCPSATNALPYDDRFEQCMGAAVSRCISECTNKYRNSLDECQSRMCRAESPTNKSAWTAVCLREQR